MLNTDIRKYAKEKNVCLWQIAESLKITDSSFSRKLRHELTPSEKAKIRRIIKEKAGE